MLPQVTLTFLLTFTLIKAVPPPGYKKAPEKPDENPPKYQYQYAIQNEKGTGQGKSEARDGIFASGRYFVQGKNSTQNVEYVADDWGYHPYVEYSNVGPHSQTVTQIALDAEAVKALRSKNSKLQIPETVNQNRFRGSNLLEVASSNQQSLGKTLLQQQQVASISAQQQNLQQRQHQPQNRRQQQDQYEQHNQYQQQNQHQQQNQYQQQNRYQQQNQHQRQNQHQHSYFVQHGLPKQTSSQVVNLQGKDLQQDEEHHTAVAQQSLQQQGQNVHFQQQQQQHVNIQQNLEKNVAQQQQEQQHQQRQQQQQQQQQIPLVVNQVNALYLQQEQQQHQQSDISQNLNQQQTIILLQQNQEGRSDLNSVQQQQLVENLQQQGHTSEKGGTVLLEQQKTFYLQQPAEVDQNVNQDEQTILIPQQLASIQQSEEQREISAQQQQQQLAESVEQNTQTSENSGAVLSEQQNSLYSQQKAEAGQNVNQAEQNILIPQQLVANVQQQSENAQEGGTILLEHQNSLHLQQIGQNLNQQISAQSVSNLEEQARILSQGGAVVLGNLQGATNHAGNLLLQQVNYGTSSNLQQQEQPPLFILQDQIINDNQQQYITQIQETYGTQSSKSNSNQNFNNMLHETAALYENSGNKLGDSQNSVGGTKLNAQYDESLLNLEHPGGYGSKITFKATHNSSPLNFLQSLKNLVSGQDVININQAINQNVEVPKFEGTTAATAIVSEYEPSSPNSICVEHEIANNAVASSTEASIISSTIESAENSESLLKQPIVVADLENYSENSLQSSRQTLLEVEEEKKISTTESTVAITPRPVSTNFLAPITAAVQLQTQNVEEESKSSQDNFVVDIQRSIPYYLGKIEYYDQVNEPQAKELNITASATQNIQLGGFLQHPVRERSKTGALAGKSLKSETFSQTLISESQENDQVQAQGQLQPQIQLIPVEGKIGPVTEPVLHPTGAIQPTRVIEKSVEVTKYVDKPYPVEVPVRVPVQVPVHVDRPVPVPVKVEVEKVIEKPVEITKYVEKPYPVRVPVQVPVQVPVHIDRPVPVPVKVEVEKIVEKPIPVPQIIEKPVHVPHPIEKRVEVPVEVAKYVDRPYPVPVAVPRPLPYPVEVEKVVEKLVQQPYPVEVRVPVQVPVQVPVPHPVQVLVEKKVPVPQYIEKPIPVEKIIEKPVPQYIPKPYPVAVKVPVPVAQAFYIPVEVPKPYPVEVTKYVNKPYAIPKPYPVQLTQTIEVPIAQPVPVEVRVPHPVPVEVPKFINKVVDKPYPIYLNGKLLSNSNQQPNNYPPNVNQENFTNAASFQSSIKFPCVDLRFLGIQKPYCPINNNIYIGLVPPKLTNEFQNTTNTGKYRKARQNFENNVRLEYGFMPPLIPSLEVDEDGNPVEKHTK